MTAHLHRPDRRQRRHGWHGYVCSTCLATFKTASAYRQHHSR